MLRIIYDTSTGEFLGGPTNRETSDGEGVLLIDQSELIHGNDREFYEVVAGVFTPKDWGVVESIKTQREADRIAEKQRVENIEAAQASSGVKRYTIEQINTYLDNRFNAITDLASAKTELREIFNKIIPYLMG